MMKQTPSCFLFQLPASYSVTLHGGAVAALLYRLPNQVISLLSEYLWVCIVYLSNRESIKCRNLTCASTCFGCSNLRSVSSSTMKSFPAALLFSLVSRLSAQSVSAPLGLSGNKIDTNSVARPRQQREDGVPEQMVRQKGRLSLPVATCGANLKPATEICWLNPVRHVTSTETKTSGGRRIHRHSRS